MQRWILNTGVFVLSLGLIAGSVRYAQGQEERRSVDPQMIYRQINRDYFAGQLEDANVQWQDLTAASDRGETILSQGTTVILIDPTVNDTESETRKTINHEACHVYLADKSQDHGPQFQACMARFKLK
jgi:hypothetical protein